MVNRTRIGQSSRAIVCALAAAGWIAGLGCDKPLSDGGGGLNENDASVEVGNPATDAAPGHRAEAIVCPPSVTPTSLQGVTCTQASDCTCNGSPGRCTDGQCSCEQCQRDEDCGATSVCSCQGQSFGFSHISYGNVCVPANCRTDADCGAGGRCSPTTSFTCGAFYGVQGYYCHTPADQCTVDGDCSAGTCRFSPEAAVWTCATGACAG